jgi:predicted DNA-binding WGR domain protein
MGMRDKVDKRLSDFEDEPTEKYFLEIFDKKINANKFWRLYIFGSFVLRHWGRHGSTGQQMTEYCYGEWYAYEYAQKLLEKKRKKGYKEEADVMTRMVRDFNDEDFE